MSCVRLPLIFLITGAIVCHLSACIDTVAPREPYKSSHSLYGLITPDRDTQFVWVHPIEEIPTLGTKDALEGVTVTSLNLQTGKSRIWHDTVIVRDNGQHEFLYRAPFRAEYGHRYRLEVSKDNERMWAEVQVPPEVDVRLVYASSESLGVEVVGGEFQLLDPKAEYLVRPRGFAPPSASYERNYWGKEKQIANGYKIKISFNFDRWWVDAWYAADYDVATAAYCPYRPSLLLGSLRLNAIVADVAWRPPGTAFDPYVLSGLGTMENVNGGTGFVGAGYRIHEKLDVPKEVVESACFFHCTSPWVCDTRDRLGKL